jgi:hypothetical protein
LDLEEFQLGQIQAKLKSLDQLGKRQPGQLVATGAQVRRRQRRAFHDIDTKDVGQNVDELLAIKATE